MNQEKIGKFILENRQKKNLTQNELAIKLGITDRAVSKWENGKCMPDISLIMNLCDILDISVNELLKGEYINKDIVKETDNNMVNILKEYYKLKRIKKIVSIFLIITLALFVQLIVVSLAFNLFHIINKIEVTTDINQYQNLIGEDAKGKYKDKWGMDEEIFPSNINGNALDFKMVYYNPFDSQYLSYLVIDYNDSNNYDNEVDRLKNYNSSDYKGFYNVTGFNHNYTLLAINADSYQGFIYALTDNNSKIIYVEIIFCNYFMDLNYKDYILEEYLPVGFDASANNTYRIKMLK